MGVVATAHGGRSTLIWRGEFLFDLEALDGTQIVNPADMP
jgi:hypothetical protein